MVAGKVKKWNKRIFSGLKRRSSAEWRKAICLKQIKQIIQRIHVSVVLLLLCINLWTN
jgi:hypothetical protein